MSLGCAYHWGSAQKTLPGGYKQIAIPVFANQTQEVGIEVDFTNAIVREFIQSELAEVVHENVAPLKLEGIIETIKTESRSAAQAQNKPEIKALPADTVLTTSYRLEVTVRLRLRRTSDQTILWENTVTNERVYSAPRIGSVVLNSANVLYNQSARRSNFASLATEMMEEGYDRMTENF